MTHDCRFPIEDHFRQSATPLGSLLTRKLESFCSLTDEDKATLLGMGAETRRVLAGRDLVIEGALPDGVFVIVEGFACRYQLSSKGSRQITAYLLPGDICDLDVLLLARMDHSIGAISTCMVAQLTPTTVQNLLKRPALARALRMATLAETANLRDWLVNIGTRPAVNRVAHLLCGLVARLRVVGLAEIDSFDFPLTQTILADTMGMSTVHMNRSLQELKGRKLIELRRKRLTILDASRLEALAGFQANCPHLGEKAAA